MGQFDQFANQGGPAAESADALAEAREKADERLRTADYSGDLPEPLSGAASEDVPTIAADASELVGSESSGTNSSGPDPDGTGPASTTATGGGDGGA